MRPHSGKPKTGYREGRSKTRASVSSSSKDRGKERERKVAKAAKVDVPWDVDELQEKQDELVTELMENTQEQDGQIASDRFAREFKKLRKKAGATNDHFNAENLNIEMLRAMLVMMLDIIPLAEQVFRKSKKESSAYALNALVNQARELSVDLRMAKDVEGQSLFIKDSILNPIFKVFAQHLIQEMIFLKNDVDTHVSSRKEGKRIKESLDKTTRSLGSFLTESVTKIHANIDDYLAGNMDKLMGPPKKPLKKVRKS